MPRSRTETLEFESADNVSAWPCRYKDEKPSCKWLAGDPPHMQHSGITSEDTGWFESCLCITGFPPHLKSHIVGNWQVKPSDWCMISWLWLMCDCHALVALYTASKGLYLYPLKTGNRCVIVLLLGFYLLDKIQVQIKDRPILPHTGWKCLHWVLELILLELRRCWRPVLLSASLVLPRHLLSGFCRFLETWIGRSGAVTLLKPSSTSNS